MDRDIISGSFIWYDGVHQERSPAVAYGKKATARTRASQGSPSIAARGDLVQFTPQKFEEASKLQTLPNPSCEGTSKQSLTKPSCDGGSKQEWEGLSGPRSSYDLQNFGRSGSAVGSQRGSDGCGDAGGRDSCNPSKTGSAEGLDQQALLEEGDDPAVARDVFTGGGASRGVGNDEEDRMELEGGGEAPTLF
ncbi:hypothetical protein CFP56_003136 [Quercus suber]|uniref:Uncharacterized protein n=1 Tax=Quercus suber TaxID=58331 RepID=A0AAW0LG86_QUESU